MFDAWGSSFVLGSLSHGKAHCECLTRLCRKKWTRGAWDSCCSPCLNPFWSVKEGIILGAMKLLGSSGAHALEPLRAVNWNMFA